MRKEIEKYELIERFLKGELNKNELDDFNSRLSSDSLFSEELELHIKMHAVIEDSSFVDLKDRIKEIHNSHAQKGPNWLGRKLYFIVLSAIAVLSIILYIVFSGPSESDVKNVNKVDFVKQNIDTTSSVLILKSNDTINERKPIEAPPIKVQKRLQSVEKGLLETLKTFLLDSIIDKPDSSTNTYIAAESLSDTSKSEVFEKDPPIIENRCKDINISATIRTEKSCDNKPTGQLIIRKESVAGGAEPYTFSINEKDFYRTYIFDNLYAKLYTLCVRDKNGCKVDLGNYIVASKDCSYEFVFAPDYNETWRIPTLDKTGEIKIYNKFGVLVYEQVFDSPGIYEWFGISGSGSSLPMGIYMFVLNLEKEDPLVGNVSIVR